MADLVDMISPSIVVLGFQIESDPKLFLASSGWGALYVKDSILDWKILN